MTIRKSEEYVFIINLTTIACQECVYPTKCLLETTLRALLCIMPSTTYKNIVRYVTTCYTYLSRSIFQTWVITISFIN